MYIVGINKFFFLKLEKKGYGMAPSSGFSNFLERKKYQLGVQVIIMFKVEYVKMPVSWMEISTTKEES